MNISISKPLILASSSPRRKELLSLLNIPFHVKTFEMDESEITGDSPEEIVCNTAMAKGLSVAEVYQDAIVISADTLVFLDNEPLYKPENEEMAITYLKKLSGKTHQVLTGVTIFYNGKCSIFFEQTSVTFYTLTDEWIRTYVKSGDSLDKAGGYGIQSEGCFFVEKINGDYNNVVGLPIGKVFQEMKKMKLISIKQQGENNDC
ncbi:MAG: nucleoside triphosphate pyrophosphatase [Paenisporosarcina sp.]